MMVAWLQGIRSWNKGIKKNLIIIVKISQS